MVIIKDLEPDRNVSQNKMEYSGRGQFIIQFDDSLKKDEILKIHTSGSIDLKVGLALQISPFWTWTP